MGKMSFAQRLRNLFSHKESAEFYDDLSDALIEGDVGAKTAFEITERLEKTCAKQHISGERDILLELKNILLEYVKATELIAAPGKTNIWMLLGVNGVGKTTSAAKLAHYFKPTAENLALASADTFRAAAIEQLALHAEKIGVRVVSHQHGADPAAVVFDAASAIGARGGGLVIADTAGRLHNKENLVRELQKIDRICREKSDDGCYKKLLAVDATTGQNALRQAEVFHEAVGIDALILTKYDSSAKGGIAISIGKELRIPTAFVCTGEKYADIAPFDAEKYVSEFLGL
ncbi:MAG: signal recognition particle-docking protein FtsY [Treponema sp.]